MSDPGHIPVLVDAVAAVLVPQVGEACVDCTLGRGGHAAALIPKLGPGGVYLGIDADADNLAFAADRLRPIAAAAGVRLALHHGNFAGLGAAMDAAGLPHADALLADLGFASNQVDDAGRGMSFRQDAPLDMRLDRSAGPTAADLLATLPERELAEVIFRFGEERLSRPIAAKITASRRQQPITTTRQLADLVRGVYASRGRRQKIDPATRTFQALRIAVNGELAALDRLLEQVPPRLAAGGRAAIISFHSLEDRPVKQAFAALAQTGPFELTHRKPVAADDAEVAANARSRSAKLRGLRRTASNAPA